MQKMRVLLDLAKQNIFFCLPFLMLPHNYVKTRVVLHFKKHVFKQTLQSTIIFLHFKNRILELDILNTPLMIQHFSNKWIDKFCLKKNHDVLLQKNMKNDPP